MTIFYLNNKTSRCTGNRRIIMKWKETTDTSMIGNYVYGLAIPNGSTFIIKYVGQASSENINRCFQHEEEAIKYLEGGRTSNEKKVEMINNYAPNGDFKIVILAHKIPTDLLNTMENIYRQMADHGTMLFNICQDEIVFENNLTNIAYTHNDKKTEDMEVIPMTVKQIECKYANRIYLSSDEIAVKLNTNCKILYVLNRYGIRNDGNIGWWKFNSKRLESIEWIVFVGKNDVIEYVFKRKDITFISNKDGIKGFKAQGLNNYIDKLKPNNGNPCFNVNDKGWNPFGRAFTYL